MKQKNKLILWASAALLAGSLLFPHSVFGKDKKDLIERIIDAESKGNPRAYRKESEARGLMQITPIVLAEWNQHNPKRKYSIEELFNPKINRELGKWYLERIEDFYLPRYGLEAHEENILASWTIGPTKHGKEIGDVKKNFKKLPSKAKEFIKQVSI